MARAASLQRRTATTAAGWIVGFLIFFPILWMVLTSFKTELEAFSTPPKFLFFHWTLENFGIVQERSNYLRFAANSIILSLGATLLGRRHVLPSVPHTLAELQVEGTFRMGSYLVTVHNPIAGDDGNLERALYGSFLPVPDQSKFPWPPAEGLEAYEDTKMPGAVVAVGIGMGAPAESVGADHNTL